MMQTRELHLQASVIGGLSHPFSGACAKVTIYGLDAFLNDILFGIVFASVTGIMVFISLDGLISADKKYSKEHYSIYGLVLGMAVKAFSLQLLF